MDRIHEIYLKKETPAKGYMWSGGRLTKNQTTARPNYIWPEAWCRIESCSEKKQEWAIEKKNRECQKSEKHLLH